MGPMMRVYLVNDDGERVFGEGPYRLLLAVEETGSLRAAAASMGMAYTKALKLLRRAETAAGSALTERRAGGSCGGGSRLTAEGKELLRKYEAYREGCMEANRAVYRAVFCPERTASSFPDGKP